LEDESTKKRKRLFGAENITRETRKEENKIYKHFKLF
jgi:hypothetical protein